jgi:hypothetical protein
MRSPAAGISAARDSGIGRAGAIVVPGDRIAMSEWSRAASAAEIPAVTGVKL